MDSIRVIIVEDEIFIVESMRLMLESIGYRVVGAASTGEDAIALIESVRPQVILMDIVLRGAIDGVETARIINERFDIPIIYATSFSDRYMLEQIRATAFYGYINKPFRESELRSAIDIALYKHATERELRDYREHLEQLVQERTAELSTANARLTREIEERIAAEKQYFKTLVEQNQILENSRTGICIIDTEYRILKANRAFAEMVESRAADILNKPCHTVMKNIWCGTMRCSLSRIIHGATDVTNEVEIPTSNGNSIFIETSVPFYSASGTVTGMLSNFTDITNIRRLERELVLVSEHERSRIERDLHDELGQVLTGAGFLAETLAKKMSAASKSERGLIADIAALINDSIIKTRNLARGLKPVKQEENGFAIALDELAAETRRVFGINVGFVSSVNDFEPDHIEATHLYYIAREAVHNAIKHGKANNITITLDRDASHILFSIKDDGCGPVKDFDSRAGMGLRIMRYRAGISGASLEFSGDSNGVQVLVRKPV